MLNKLNLFNVSFLNTNQLSPEIMRILYNIFEWIIKLAILQFEKHTQLCKLEEM